MTPVPAIVNFLRGPDLVFETAHPDTIRRLGGREVLGKPLLEAIPEYRNHPFPHILRSVMESGEAFSATEVPARFDRDGSGSLEESFWNVVYQPVRSASGIVDGVMTFDLDVTEQVHARRKLEEQSSALIQALERAAEGDHRKNEFMAILAHELRGPLGPVMNSLEIMKRADADPALRERARVMMERQIVQMKRLIDDLLDVSRIARNQIEITKTHVNLGLVLEQAVDASRPLCKAAGHTLRVAPLADPIYLEADAARLTQVFDNLLTNACKYTDSGGRIDVSIERQGSDVVVRVADSGIGLEPGHLARVFEKFVQIDRSAGRARGGLGLGLALVRQLVELHGGTVTAESEGPGQGSTFSVRLPILTSLPVVRELPPQRTLPIPGSLRRILLVDDNRDSVESLALLLSVEGYETKTAHDGVEAIEIAESFRPNVILLDIGLPLISGYEVCRRIRAESWGKDIVVFAHTGWGHEDDRRRTSEAGFDGHLLKPVDFAALIKLIATPPPS